MCFSVRICVRGKHRQNIERDVHRRLSKLLRCNVEPFWIDLRVLNERGVLETKTWATLAPCEVMGAIWRTSAEYFSEAILGGLDEQTASEVIVDGR